MAFSQYKTTKISFSKFGLCHLCTHDAITSCKKKKVMNGLRYVQRLKDGLTD